jgi:hypothetical protein
MSFESRRGLKKRKEKKRKRFVPWKAYCLKTIIFNFSLLLFFCTSKMIVGYFNNYDYLMKI